MKIERWGSEEEYQKAQVKRHNQKIHTVWVLQEELSTVATLIVKHLVPSHKTAHTIGLKGLCHGVRTGYEVEQLVHFLGLDEGSIIGTDVGEKANRGKNYVYCHDFHHEREEWKGAFNFVYSNSLDHAHNPVGALSAWKEQLKEGGLLMLHWSPGHSGQSSPADCFVATANEYWQLIDQIGLERLEDVETVLRHNNSKKRRLLVAKIRSND